MSEHKADSTPDVSGDHVDTGVTAAAGPHDADVHVDAPKLVPGQGDEPSGADRRAQMPKREAPKLGAPGRITIMAPSRESASHGASREHTWEDFVNSEPKIEPAQKPGQSRMLAIAAMIALGITVGAVGGSVAMSGLGKLFAADDTRSSTQALEEHIARLDGELTALKAEVDRNAKQSIAARAKSADRLDKLEKAQAEPAAKLAKLSETVEKLRTTPPPAAAPAPAPAPVASAPAKEVTGSINAPVPTPAPKPEVARMPTVEGWRILDIAGGGATIEGRAGIFEVYAGDPVPGLGRVDAIRKQDGRWTVVTSRGLIVAR